MNCGVQQPKYWIYRLLGAYAALSNCRAVDCRFAQPLTSVKLRCMRYGRVYTG